MVWPEWYSRVIVEVVILENLASILHFLFAILVAMLGCGARVFWAYAFYQLLTTTLKTLLIPGYPLSDWTWDFLGDTLEFLTGIGLATVLGLDSRIRPSPVVKRACSTRGILVGLALLMLLWTIAFLNSTGRL